MEDRELICADCKKEFLFSVEDQKYYLERGFAHDPKRCKTCRAKRRALRVGTKGNKPLYKVRCDSCGEAAIVPFHPTGIKPVLCSKCFAMNQNPDNKATPDIALSSNA